MNRKNQSGFSLIELVVVMAIVGILMMVGVPQVQSYIAKAKRTEMRTNLAQLYAAEKSFYAEYSTYHEYIYHAGYRPEGKMNYIYGFTDVGTTVMPNHLASIGTNTHSSTDSYCVAESDAAADTAPCLLSPSALDTTVSEDYEVNQSQFLAFAAGKPADESMVDEWSIDHRKIFSMVTNGIDP